MSLRILTIIILNIFQWKAAGGLILCLVQLYSTLLKVGLSICFLNKHRRSEAAWRAGSGHHVSFIFMVCDTFLYKMLMTVALACFNFGQSLWKATVKSEIQQLMEWEHWMRILTKWQLVLCGENCWYVQWYKPLNCAIQIRINCFFVFKNCSEWSYLQHFQQWLVSVFWFPSITDKK